MSDAVPGRRLTACALGPLGYAAGLDLQQALVMARAEGRTGDWLLFPDHPPVLTLGRGGGRDSLRISEAELARRGIELFEVARGGDMTWHGPGQLVGYTIFDLECVARDLHEFLRGLEEALRATLAGFGIDSRTVEGRTGIWVGDEKIASIGIAVRRWVSYHGFALNVAPDLGFFDLIHPCGLHGVRMTSMERLLGAAPPLEQVREAAARAVARQFGFDAPVWAEPAEVRAWWTRPEERVPLAPPPHGEPRRPAAGVGRREGAST